MTFALFLIIVAVAIVAFALGAWFGIVGERGRCAGLCVQAVTGTGHEKLSRVYSAITKGRPRLPTEGEFFGREKSR